MSNPEDEKIDYTPCQECGEYCEQVYCSLRCYQESQN